jgi:PAS domain S-box-containing protein
MGSKNIPVSIYQVTMQDLFLDISDSPLGFLEKIAKSSPVILYVFDLQEMRNVWVNGSIFMTLGYTEEEIAAMGSSILPDLMHPEDMERYAGHHARLLKLAPDETARFEYRLRSSSGEWRWILSEEATYSYDGDGAVTRIHGSAIDITERKLREQKIEFLMNELSHRIKNLFAVVESLISLSARDSGSVSEVVERLLQRVHALGQAHAINQDQATDSFRHLTEIVELTLAPFLLDDRIKISGTSVMMHQTKVTPIGLIAHELAANSAKYGALRDPNGRVTVEVSVQPKASDCQVTVVWREHCEKIKGHTTDAPKGLGKPGFGTLVMETSILQIEGEIERMWTDIGLQTTIKFPVNTGAVAT